MSYNFMSYNQYSPHNLMDVGSVLDAIMGTILNDGQGLGNTMRTIH